MKNFKFNGLSAKLFTWVFIQVFIFAAAMQARADDVYNFYFQKAPQGSITNGPPQVSVQQGTQSAKAPVNNAPSSAVPQGQPKPAAQSTQSVPFAEDSVPDWELSFGYSWLSGGDGAGGNFMALEGPLDGYAGTYQDVSGATVGVRGNVNSWLGIEGSYTFMRMKSDTHFASRSLDSAFGMAVSRFSSEQDHHLYSAALVFTPIRIWGRSHDFLTLGSKVGVTRTVNRTHKAFIHPEGSLFISRAVGFRIGFRYIIDNQINSAFRLFDGPDTKMYTASLVTRF